MSKKALLAVMMALVLLLSGCTLIQKDEAVDKETVIIKMGDQEITKEKVQKQVQSELDYMEYYYYMMGRSFDVTDPSNIAMAQEEAVNALKQDLALTAKAKELGLDQLTEEELASVKESAQKDYDEAIDYVKTSVLTDTEGMDEEALAKAAEDKVAELGYSLETYIESETKTVIDNKLREYAIKDVTVSDEEIETEYNSKIESDKATYAENAASWAVNSNSGYTLYYTPAGVRRVKQILIKFKDEDKTAITEAQQKMSDATTARSSAQAKIDSANETLSELEGDTDEIKEARETAQANLDAAQKELEEADKALLDATQAVSDAQDKAFANLDAEVDEILASLDAEGADWQAIMDEKDQSASSRNKETGYAMASGMTSFDTEVVDAAMALETVGAHSGKVKGPKTGYYILRYEGDETEGPVALDTVKETISSSLLSTKQTTAYNEAVNQWVEEAGIKVDMNALKN